MIELREIDRDNYCDVINLSVHDEQKEYIASNVFSLAQAKAQPECVPLAIYNDDVLVGFAMYCMDVDDKEYWIYRIMIDKSFQGKGYGREAMQSILSRIQQDKEHDIVYLSFDPENTSAKKLYEQLGFLPDGRVIHGEIVYCLRFGI